VILKRIHVAFSKRTVSVPWALSKPVMECPLMTLVSLGLGFMAWLAAGTGPKKGFNIVSVRKLQRYPIAYQAHGFEAGICVGSQGALKDPYCQRVKPSRNNPSRHAGASVLRGLDVPLPARASLNGTVLAVIARPTGGAVCGPRAPAR
jgi:hypothetical protein